MARELVQLQRDADTLIESLREDWRAITDPTVIPGAREGIRIHMQWCMEELEGLWKRIERFDA